MNFLLTHYIYPLREEIQLSRSEHFYFDNPRTEEEISFIEDYLIRAYESGYDWSLPIHSDDPIMTIENTLLDFREKLSTHDKYVLDFYESYNREQIFNFIAQMWVVVRYSDEDEFSKIRGMQKEMLEEGVTGIVMLEESNPILVNSEKVSNYCSLLSLLCHSERDEYFGRSILLDPNRIDSTMPPSRFVWRNFTIFGFTTYSFPNYHSKEILQWTYLPYAIDDIKKTSQLLEQAFDKGLADKLLYIGGVLRITSHETGDIKVRILLLTSIIELLLTHSPNYQRFNVEDSISKQFQLKAALLIYLNDDTRNLEQIKKRLKTIYQQRSNIAHGNFAAVQKYIRGLSKKEGKEEYFDDLVVDLYLYNRIILEAYLKDTQLVSFLKQG